MDSKTAVGSVGHADSTGVRRESRGSTQTQGAVPVRTIGDPVVSSGKACAGHWADHEWVPCRNPRDPNQTDFRPVAPGTLPLAHGIANRVGRLRAYGNAIVPQVAAAFITATLQSLDMEV